MNKVNQLQSALHRLFKVISLPDRHSGCILEGLNFEGLYQYVRAHSEPVCSFSVVPSGGDGGKLSFSGKEIFHCPAFCLYTDDKMLAGDDFISLGRDYELWLLEDMSFAVVVKTETYVESGDYSICHRYVLTTNMKRFTREMHIDSNHLLFDLVDWVDEQESYLMPLYDF